MQTHSPAPLDGEPAAADDELVEGLLCGELSGLPRGELDEGALLPLHYGGGADLPKLVKVVPVWRGGGSRHRTAAQTVPYFSAYHKITSAIVRVFYHFITQNSSNLSKYTLILHSMY